MGSASSLDGLSTDNESPTNNNETPVEGSQCFPGISLQKNSCRKALPNGPLPTESEPNLSWCHSCWNAEDGVDEDTMCTFKGTRLLDSDGYRVRGFQTRYKHNGLAPELAFHDDWRPSSPNFNHIKALTVSAS
jgi:hypothetical protein